MRTSVLAPLACALVLLAVDAQAQTAEKIRIGFLTDMSSVFADIDGKNGAVAIQMAIDDFGGKVLGRPIELLSADHQNKADIGAGSPALTNEQCSPYTVHYAFDTVALSRGTGTAVVAGGGKNWYFLTADYVFGHSLEGDTSKVVQGSGGSVAGAVRHPLNASDFSSFLMQAQNSKAQILGLATAGTDAHNAIKAAREFGITRSMKMAALMFFNTDVHALGMKNTEGLLFTTSWDWSLSEASRGFGQKFFAKTKRMPSDLQAADYSATMNYLKAVQAAGTTDADAVMAKLKGTPIDDFYAKGQIRPDGRFVHDMYLMQVKAPAESKEPWDYLKLVKQLPGEEVFTRKAESRCALWQ